MVRFDIRTSWLAEYNCIGVTHGVKTLLNSLLYLSCLLIIPGPMLGDNIVGIVVVLFDIVVWTIVVLANSDDVGAGVALVDIDVGVDVVWADNDVVRDVTLADAEVGVDAVLGSTDLDGDACTNTSPWIPTR